MDLASEFDDPSYMALQGVFGVHEESCARVQCYCN